MRALKERLATEVMMMDFGEGEETVDECYVTGGHVDLYTAIQRGGGKGSTWKYCPGQVAHCWLNEDDKFTMENPGGDCLPITVVLEPEAGELHKQPDGTYALQFQSTEDNAKNTKTSVTITWP